MYLKELKEELKKAETKEEQDRMMNEYWESHAWVRFGAYSFVFIVTLFVLGVGIGLFIRLIKLIAF